MLWTWGGAENCAEQPEVSGGSGREGRSSYQEEYISQWEHICLGLSAHLCNSGLCVQPQYSQKEDKYEEEIKVLTDKLKEVRAPESR